MIKKIAGCLVLVAFCSGFSFSQDKKSDSGFSFGAGYTGDMFANFSGGIKTGTTYLGMATINAAFDTEKAAWWKGGEAFVKLANTHGGEPSANLVGDFQGVSNIEAGNLTWLYELWLKQSIGSFTLIAGLQDLNVNFAASENGAVFTNSSFGVHSSIADNVTSPIFPLTALGLNLQWQINNDMMWQVAVFDGTPDDFENNPYNLNWKLNETDGYLAVSEFQIAKSLLKSKTGTYKLGLYYHKHLDEGIVDRNYGIYFVGDQQLTNKLSVFSQIGLSPQTINLHHHYYSLGLNMQKPFKNRENDVYGLAVAYAGIDGNGLGGETAIEMTYKFQICENLYIRPDLQYIINPAGTGSKLPNAFVGFVRVGVEF